MSSTEVSKPENDDPLVGQLMADRYRILSVLGRGGVGVVYKAQHIHIGRVVAVKTLLATMLSGDHDFLRFQQEAKAASLLSHPNVVNIHDFGVTAQGQAYLIMDYIDGRSLDDLVQQDGCLGLDRFLRIFSQVCDGLQHAHKKGIIHRDIKGSNLMLVDTEDATDVVKIVDFGLAKLTTADTEQNLTKTGIIVGSPLFMSPELCRGQGIDSRSDIYSVGCVMYRSLTGHLPIFGQTVMDTLYKHIAEPPLSFHEVAPNLSLPIGLEQAILKTLEKDPEKRQQSMAELGKNIADAIKNYSQWSAAVGIGSGTVSMAPGMASNSFGTNGNQSGLQPGPGGHGSQPGLSGAGSQPSFAGAVPQSSLTSTASQSNFVGAGSQAGIAGSASQSGLNPSPSTSGYIDRTVSTSRSSLTTGIPPLQPAAAPETAGAMGKGASNAARSVVTTASRRTQKTSKSKTVVMTLAAVGTVALLLGGAAVAMYNTVPTFREMLHPSTIEPVAAPALATQAPPTSASAAQLTEQTSPTATSSLRTSPITTAPASAAQVAPKPVKPPRKAETRKSDSSSAKKMVAQLDALQEEADAAFYSDDWDKAAQLYQKCLKIKEADIGSSSPLIVPAPHASYGLLDSRETAG